MGIKPDKCMQPEKNDMQIRIHTSAWRKVSEIADIMRITKIKSLSLLVDVAYVLALKMKKHVRLINDPRCTIKIFFDEDQRTEIHF